MSIVITTFSDENIILCADKRATNMKTGEFHDNEVKIERWYRDLAIGTAGCSADSKIILPLVRNYIESENISHAVEDVSDLLGQCFYILQEEYPERPKGLTVKFMVAGKLKNGKLGVGDILANDDGPDLEIYEGKEKMSSIFFAPDDVTDWECNQLFLKAAGTMSGNMSLDAYMEAVHRKTVEYVSKKSKFVGKTSDYIKITVDDIK